MAWDLTSRRGGRRKEIVPRGEYGDPFSSLRRAMDNLFDSFFREMDFPLLGGRTFTEESTYIPRLDVCESDKEYEVAVELPGLEEEDVKITLEDGALLIEGEKPEPKGVEAFLRCERVYGKFEREVPLPKGVDQENLRAEFRSGVLMIRIPKTEGSKRERRQIPIST